jgi:hypothetical protein
LAPSPTLNGDRRALVGSEIVAGRVARGHHQLGLAAAGGRRQGHHPHVGLLGRCAADAYHRRDRARPAQLDTTRRGRGGLEQERVDAGHGARGQARAIGALAIVLEADRRRGGKDTRPYPLVLEELRRRALARGGERLEALRRLGPRGIGGQQIGDAVDRPQQGGRHRCPPHGLAAVAQLEHDVERVADPVVAPREAGSGRAAMIVDDGGGLEGNARPPADLEPPFAARHHATRRRRDREDPVEGPPDDAAFRGHVDTVLLHPEIERRAARPAQLQDDLADARRDGKRLDGLVARERAAPVGDQLGRGGVQRVHQGHGEELLQRRRIDVEARDAPGGGGDGAEYRLATAARRRARCRWYGSGCRRCSAAR